MATERGLEIKGEAGRQDREREPGGLVAEMVGGRETDMKAKAERRAEPQGQRNDSGETETRGEGRAWQCP